MSRPRFNTAQQDNTRASSANPGRDAAIAQSHRAAGINVRNDVARAAAISVATLASPKVTAARVGVFTAVSLHQNCQSCHSYVSRPPREPGYRMKKVPLPESLTADEDEEE